MSAESKTKTTTSDSAKRLIIREQPILPLTNYTLSTVCPSCGAETIRHACKVRCPRCGFLWDCSEL